MKINNNAILASISFATSMLFTTSLEAEDNFHYTYATVLSATPVHRIIEVSRDEQKCFTEEVTYQRPKRGKNGNSLVGGIIGAAVGHAIGHKTHHKTGATIAGALVGASIASNSQEQVTKTGVRRRCEMVPTSWEEERLVGYNVVYRYNDKTYETRLPNDPGDSLRIRVLVTPVAENYADE